MGAARILMDSGPACISMDRGRESGHNHTVINSFFSSMGSRENIPLTVAFAVTVSLILAWMSPAEATLGQAVKLVYVHAALMWVAFGILTIAGGTGLLYAFWRRSTLLAWSNGSVATAVGLLVFTGFLGLVTAKVTWGGISWSEPRLLMLGEIILVGLVAALVALVSRPSIYVALVNLAFAGVAWWLLIATERIIHPVSPIFSSESVTIKIFPLLITAGFAFAGVQMVRYLVDPRARKRD